MFTDKDKFPIPIAHNGFRTRIEIENYVNKVKYSDEDKDNVKYSNIRCAIHGVE